MQAQSFDAFGNVENQSGEIVVPFGFAGGLTDQDTNLVRFGARDYDPMLFPPIDNNTYNYANVLGTSLYIPPDQPSTNACYP